jgi:uncharacterized Zn finger protein
MASVADLVDPPSLEALAGAYVVTAGTSLVTRDAVRIVEIDPQHVVAEVVDDETRRVELSAATQSLEWSCSCPSGAEGTPCPHLAAVAVETWRRAPDRRT